MKVRYTLRARDDLETIFAYLDERNPAAAQDAKDLIERRIRRLSDVSAHGAGYRRIRHS